MSTQKQLLENMRLQSILNSKGANLVVDGVMGSKTQAAMQKYFGVSAQAAYGGATSGGQGTSSSKPVTTTANSGAAKSYYVPATVASAQTPAYKRTAQEQPLNQQERDILEALKSIGTIWQQEMFLKEIEEYGEWAAYNKYVGSAARERERMEQESVFYKKANSMKNSETSGGAEVKKPYDMGAGFMSVPGGVANTAREYKIDVPQRPKAEKPKITDAAQTMHTAVFGGTGQEVRELLKLYGITPELPMQEKRLRTSDPYERAGIMGSSPAGIKPELEARKKAEKEAINNEPRYSAKAQFAAKDMLEEELAVPNPEGWKRIEEKRKELNTMHTKYNQLTPSLGQFDTSSIHAFRIPETKEELKADILAICIELVDDMEEVKSTYVDSNYYEAMDKLEKVQRCLKEENKAVNAIGHGNPTLEAYQRAKQATAATDEAYKKYAGISFKLNAETAKNYYAVKHRDIHSKRVLITKQEQEAARAAIDDIVKEVQASKQAGTLSSREGLDATRVIMAIGEKLDWQAAGSGAVNELLWGIPELGQSYEQLTSAGPDGEPNGIRPEDQQLMYLQTGKLANPRAYGMGAEIVKDIQTALTLLGWSKVAIDQLVGTVLMDKTKDVVTNVAKKGIDKSANNNRNPASIF